MTCDMKQLDLMADGELRPWNAWRLRRHIAHCPACAAELAAIQHLTQRACAWRTTPVTLFSDAPLAAPSARPRLPWRPAAALTAGCAVTVAVALWSPGQPAHPTPTFADVQKAMAQVNSMYYEQETTGYYIYGQHKGQLKYRNMASVWTQSNPPANAVNPIHNALWYPHTPAWRHYVLTTKGTGTFDVQSHTFVIQTGPVYRETQESVEQTLHQFSSAAAYRSPSYPYPFVYSGLIHFHGTSMLKFVYVSPRRDLSGIKVADYSTVILLSDPQTKRVCYVDQEDMLFGKVDLSVVQSNFRYNQTPPPGTFEFAYPGVRVKVVK